ncbi:peptidase [Sphaerospermopsis aphanizomenoides BCCUSP55]|uniref:peptidase n=1 Tax=Sphaerospermopsis aphanizomenoides TaxID=459663 RepID=UPI0019059762|nr:peptidase [Sphaerospermopsis aphanizomenoides]MBK1988357.1 peptidase [Sphaerospermopsis aphanizomenoides BCCUSP55]
MGKISQKPRYKTRNNRLIGWKLLAVLTLFMSTGLLVTLTNFSVNAVFREQERNFQLSISLPISQKSYPLPPSLKNWQDKTNSGDYFDNIQSTKVGYLIWSLFPVKVKIETPTEINKKQSQIWVNSVLQAVQEWNTYLPLEVVENSAVADIRIFRKAPPLQIETASKIPRARSALTTYELYNQNNVLSHRFTILLSPSQTGEYVQAAARHELGHALGIWGHSPLPTDALYFSQVRKPASISTRDVNTLKKVYEQSTSLGSSQVKK